MSPPLFLSLLFFSGYFFLMHFAQHSNALHYSDISDGGSLVEVEVGDD